LEKLISSLRKLLTFIGTRLKTPTLY